MRSNPIDFGVKVILRKVEFVVARGYLSLLGQFTFHSEVILFKKYWNLSFWYIFMQISWIFRAIVPKVC